MSRNNSHNFESQTNSNPLSNIPNKTEDGFHFSECSGQAGYLAQRSYPKYSFTDQNYHYPTLHCCIGPSILAHLSS